MSQSIPQQEKADWHMVKRGTLIFFFPIRPCIFKVLRLQTLNLYFWIGLGLFCLFVCLGFLLLLFNLICCPAFPEFELLDAWYLEYLVQVTWNTRIKSHYLKYWSIYTAVCDEFPSVFYNHKPLLKIKKNYLHQQRKSSDWKIWSRRILVFAEFPVLDFVAL